PAPPRTGGACVNPPANIVNWWTGSANDNLTLQGGATFAAGQVGQAFQLDGSTGFASAGNPASLRLTSALTIEAWIFPRIAPAPGNQAAVLTKWAQNTSDIADADSYGLWIRQEASGLNLFGAIHQSGSKEPSIQGGTI